jgi:hypothetical protein
MAVFNIITALQVVVQSRCSLAQGAIQVAFVACTWAIRMSASWDTSKGVRASMEYYVCIGSLPHKKAEWIIFCTHSLTIDSTPARPTAGTILFPGLWRPSMGLLSEL